MAKKGRPKKEEVDPIPLAIVEYQEARRRAKVLKEKLIKLIEED